MSDSEKVNAFNPILVGMWVTQLLLLYLDWKPDKNVRWSIPVIGSFFVIQIYFVWRTNYDEMMDERRTAQSRALGGPLDTPLIDPLSNDLESVYSSKNDPTKIDPKKMTNINPPKDED